MLMFDFHFFFFIKKFLFEQLQLPIFVQIQELYFLLLRIPVLLVDDLLAFVESGEGKLVLLLQFLDFLLVGLDLRDGVDFRIKQKLLVG